MTPTHRHVSVGWPVKIYIHQLYINSGCSQEWPIGIDGERESKESMLSPQLDNDEIHAIIIHLIQWKCHGKRKFSAVVLTLVKITGLAHLEDVYFGFLAVNKLMTAKM